MNQFSDCRRELSQVHGTLAHKLHTKFVHDDFFFMDLGKLDLNY